MKVCSVDGCEKPKRARGMCQMHYNRTVRNGGPNVVKQVQRAKRGACTVAGCDERDNGQSGYCLMHYTRWKRHGDPEHVFLKTNWVGGAAAYRTVHSRTERAKGKASEHSCVSCGGPAEHWAYDHGDPDEKLSPQGYRYSTSPDHYMPMCAPCHGDFDARERRPA